MADINFLSDGPKKDGESSAKGAAPQPADDVAMHVPKPTAPEPKSAPGPDSGFLGGVSRMFAKPEPKDDEAGRLFSQKLPPPAPAPAPPVPPAPKPAPAPLKLAVPAPPPPTPPKPPGPPKPPPPPPPKNGGKAPDPKGGGTLRVSLIAGAGGGGMTDMAVRERVRTFVLVAALGLVIDALIFGGLLYYKSRVVAQVQAAEGDIQNVDKAIIEGEAKVKDARSFQALTAAAKSVLEAHNHWTRLFALIEEVALAQVQFTNMSGAESGNVSADVLAADYTTLARQMQALQNDPRFTSVSVNTASAELGEGGIVRGVRSALAFSFDTEVIKSASTETLAGRFDLPKGTYAVGERIQGTFTLDNYGEPFLATVTTSGGKGGGFSTFELKDTREFVIDFTPDRAGAVVFSYTVTKNEDPTFQKVFERRIDVIGARAQ